MDFKTLLSDEARADMGLERNAQSPDFSSKRKEQIDLQALQITRLERLLARYSAELKKIEYQRSLVPPFNWIPASEVIRLLGISRRTLFNWRDEGVIGISSIRGKLYCKRSDVEKLLADHYKKGATDNC